VCSGGDLLRRLQRLRGLLDQQRRRAQAAGAAGTGGGANQQHCALTTNSSSGSGSSPGCRPVRLLVVDSVAHVFRDLGEGGPGGSGGAAELTERTELLFKISALLRWVLAAPQIGEVRRPLRDVVCHGGRGGF
jgi:hypothetical protein